MSIFKCKLCDGDVNIIDDFGTVKKIECKKCGYQNNHKVKKQEVEVYRIK